MGREIAATAMNSQNRSQARNGGKNDYDGEEAVSPTSSHFSNQDYSPPENRDQNKASTVTQPMAPKKYCCTNSAQSESKIWAIFDIVTACLVLIVQLYFTITLKTDRHLLQAIVDSDKDNEKDLNRFLQYTPLKQDLILTVVICREIVSVLLGILLYTSANLRIHQQLRIWLGSTFIAIVVDLFLFIPKMAFTQNKFLYVAGMIAYFLYKWYEVWIVTILFKEIRQEINDQKLVGDVRTQESEQDHDKPPDIGTISGAGHLRNNMGIIGVNPGKTYPSNNMDYGGMMPQSGYGSVSSRGYGNAGRDSVLGYSESIRNYDTRGGRGGNAGWEPDPMGSTSTFVLAQPPKKLKFQPRHADLTMVESKSPIQAEYFGSSRY